MKILELHPIDEILNKPNVNNPEAKLVWQLAYTQQSLASLKGAVAKYLVSEEEGKKLEPDFAQEDEKALSDIARKRARLIERQQKISAAIFKLDEIAEAAGVEPDITMMNRKLELLSIELNAAEEMGISVDDKRSGYEKYQALANAYREVLVEASTY